ncbi:Hypothetical protein D9617_5g071310 [Elsinoe fawcettii]|nr:Hypothetical protein D9617_5g071310 [Elsinoe fawcettii]
MPRIASVSLWSSLVPKPLRKTPKDTVKNGVPQKREWNPATFFIVISLIIGSNAIQLVSLKTHHLNYTRSTDAKLSLLREVIDRVQKGEDVDVETMLGKGDPEREREWEEVMKDLEKEEDPWARDRSSPSPAAFEPSTTVVPIFDPISSEDESSSQHSRSSTSSVETEVQDHPPLVPEKEDTARPSAVRTAEDSADYVEVEKTDHASVSDAHSSGEDSAPITTPQLSSDESSQNASIKQDEGEENSDPETSMALPQTTLTSFLRAPTPLVQDSPTRYGLEEAMETARVAVTREIQKKRAITGPELFRQALDLQITTRYTNMQHQPKPVHHRVLPEYPNPSLRVYRPRNKYSPAQLFRRTLAKQHPLPPPRGRDPSPRIFRLLRRPYPLNLIRDDATSTSTHPAVANVRYALAPPILASQRFCHLHHAAWHELGNLWHAVECAICLCAGGCESDTKIMFMCDFCAIRICAECRQVFEEAGIMGLMKRERSGAATVEARRGRANGRNSMANRP